MKISEEDFKVLNYIKKLDKVDSHLLFQIFLIIFGLGKNEEKENRVKLALGDILLVLNYELMHISITKKSKKYSCHYPDKGFYILKTHYIKFIWDKRISHEDMIKLITNAFKVNLEFDLESGVFEEFKKIFICNN